MKRLKFKDPYDGDDSYSYDIERIVNIFADRGYEISYNDAKLAWKNHSDMMCAGWLILDESDEHVYLNVSRHFEEVE